MRILTLFVYSLVIVVTSSAAPPPLYQPPSLICARDLPHDGYPSGFNTYAARVASMRALCVTLDPGPRCECVMIANGSWQVVCRPTGAFASLPSWPNVVTRCVWGCSCYSTPDNYVPTNNDLALARAMPGLVPNKAN